MCVGVSIPCCCYREDAQVSAGGAEAVLSSVPSDPAADSPLQRKEVELSVWVKTGWLARQKEQYWFWKAEGPDWPRTLS